MPLSSCGCQECEISAAENLDYEERNRLIDQGVIVLDDYDEIMEVNWSANSHTVLANVLHEHGWRPREWDYRGTGPVYLGMELEIEIARSQGMREYARRAQDLLGDVVYIQTDSSITYGFEVTTHPMSYQWAMGEFRWDALRTMADDGCFTTPEVGLHVHVARTAFDGECHLFRWMKFVYRNEQQVSRLARRRHSSWARFDPDQRAAVKHFLKAEDTRRGYRLDRDGRATYLPPADRYTAVNPLNADTLELRVFASSLQPGEVKAALAFAASTVEYTRDLDANKIIRGNGWAWPAYVEWLRSHDEYRPLLDELEALSCVS